MYANYFYDTLVIFSNSIITYRELFTICIGHDRWTDVIGIDCKRAFWQTCQSPYISSWSQMCGFRQNFKLNSDLRFDNEHFQAHSYLEILKINSVINIDSNFMLKLLNWFLHYPTFVFRLAVAIMKLIFENIPVIWWENGYYVVYGHVFLCGSILAYVCRPCTLLSIWTFVSCVRGLLSPASLNMRARATLRGVMLVLRISTHKNVRAFLDRAPSPDEW